MTFVLSNGTQLHSNDLTSWAPEEWLAYKKLLPNLGACKNISFPAIVDSRLCWVFLRAESLSHILLTDAERLLLNNAEAGPATDADGEALSLYKFVIYADAEGKAGPPIYQEVFQNTNHRLPKSTFEAILGHVPQIEPLIPDGVEPQYKISDSRNNVVDSGSLYDLLETYMPPKE